MMGLDEKQKGEVLEGICVIVDGIVKGYVTEQGRIKSVRNYIYQPLKHKLLEEYPFFYSSVTSGVVYELFESLVKSTDAIEEDPDRPGQFITHGAEWREFRKKQKTQNL